jgi:hypothetical protein
MNNSIRNFKDDVAKVSLSQTEKIVLRDEMFAFMEKNPPSIKGVGGVHDAKGPVISPLNPLYFFKPRTFAGLGVAALMILSVSIKAEASTPGDFLYPVKIHFNEAIVESLALTPEAEAAVNINFTKKRLNETVRLAAENRVKKEYLDDIRMKIKEYDSDIQKYINESSSKGDIAEAIEASSDIHTIFSAHLTVMKTIVETYKENQQGNSDLSELSMELDTQKAKYSKQTESLTSVENFELSHSENEIDLANKNLEDAEEALSTATQSVKNLGVDTTLDSIYKLITEGKEQIKNHDNENAFLFFEKAEQIANEITIISESTEIFEEALD